MKYKIFIFLFIFIIIYSGAAFALNTPHVSRGGGAITLMITSNQDIAAGIEYGFTNEMAVTADWKTPFTRAGIKYQTGTTTALQAGISKNIRPYIGFNASHWIINGTLEGVFEINLLFREDGVALPYEFGVRAPLDRGFDIRMGGFGSVGIDSFSIPDFKIGLGYRF